MAGKSALEINSDRLLIMTSSWEDELKYGTVQHGSTVHHHDPFSDDDEAPLARTRVDESARRSASPLLDATGAAAAPSHMEQEPGLSDRAWFLPQHDQHYRRKEAAALVATPGAFSASAQAASAVAALSAAEWKAPAPAHVDGTFSASQQRAMEKAAFLANWQRQQQEAQQATAQSFVDALAAQPPPPPKSKVAFRPMPVDQQFGPSENAAHHIDTHLRRCTAPPYLAAA